jgi:hypothetical protein
MTSNGGMLRAGESKTHKIGAVFLEGKKSEAFGEVVIGFVLCRPNGAEFRAKPSRTRA